MGHLTEKINSFPRVELVNVATPLEYLARFSAHLGRDVYIKRDDVTPLAMGGNKLRKLEFLVADAKLKGANVLVTAGAIQSNHVRQTAAVAAKYGMRCVAILENPINTDSENYLHNGNSYLIDLFGCEVELVDELNAPDEQLDAVRLRLEQQGFIPYVVPIGGSNALGSIGYVVCATEIAAQAEAMGIDFAAVVVPSGSAGTHAGLAVGLEQLMPECELVGVTVSRVVDTQAPKVIKLQQEVAALLDVSAAAKISLWDEYFLPMYGMPNEQGMAAVKLLARLEGITLDPVYTGKAMAGLIDGIKTDKFGKQGPLLFVHTGGSPALFAYYPSV
ncbi:D-cysteine desulfhydrase [Aeromonas allosaccharophila]|uniref:D-cysteine desulfhydrase n=2 Tax=Aeromonas TaxID=642 RepID=UPI001BCAF29E|nr:D-cysteine desulfhydrase [Aeromonas allosaccharophila]MBS4694810.1 D-cysteine desulfhydrase [Aeromonas allosaccharophila]